MPTATLDLERVTPNIYTTTKLRGCNPSFVTTSEGVVVIDTPQLPTRAVAMRAEAESHGPIRYLINTEHHVDHIFGNYWFKGVPVVEHQGAVRQLHGRRPRTSIRIAYALEAVPTDDPEAASIVPDRDTYYADPNKGTIVFTGDLTLRVGDHTFHLLHTPGHTPGQIAVHVPEERAVFTGDTIFNELPDVADDVERRPVARGTRADPPARRRPPDSRARAGDQTLKYVDTQRQVLLEWKAAVADAVAKGWTREETMQRVRFDEKFGPVDVGQGYMMDHIQTLNAGSLWDKFTALGYSKGR